MRRRTHLLLFLLQLALLLSNFVPFVLSRFLYSGRLVLARDDPQLMQLVHDPSASVTAARWKAMLPSADTVTKQRFQTCAIVGSSGTLLQHSFGAAIDRAQLVVRFNAAPVDAQFSPHVGSKTTWRFVNDPLWLRLADRATLRPADRGRVFTTCVSAKNSFFKFPYANRSRIFDHCIHPHFLEHVARFMPPTRSAAQAEQRPTTGLIAVFFLINLCDNIALFGFDHRNETYHYWASGKAKRIGVHSWSHEAALLRKMQQLRLLSIRRN